MLGSGAPAPMPGGGNPGGFSGSTGAGSGALGVLPSPLIPTFPAGQAGLSLDSPLATNRNQSFLPQEPPFGPGAGTGAGSSGGHGPSGLPDPSFPANTGGASAPGATGINLATALGFGGNESSFLKAMSSAGFGSGVGQLLWNFLQSGAGFNPQVLQSLFASLQPQVSRGLANIQEQFGAEGLGSSSPAAIGMGDFLSQVNLNEGQIASQMYEQSVQNYLSVLMGGKAPQQPSGLGALIGGAGTLAGGLANLYKVLFPGNQNTNTSGGPAPSPVPTPAPPDPGIGGDPGVPWGIPF